MRALAFAAAVFVAAPLAAQEGGGRALDGGLLDPAWFAPEADFRPQSPLDYLWIRPGFRLGEAAVHVADFPPPLIPKHRDERDRAYAAWMGREIATQVRRKLRTAPEDQAAYLLVGRVVDERSDRQMVLGFRLEHVTFELKLVDRATGQTVAGLHHRVVEYQPVTLFAGLPASGWWQDPLGAFLKALGAAPLAPLPSTLWAKEPAWALEEGSSVWRWIHPDLASRLGPIQCVPWGPPLCEGASHPWMHQVWSDRMAALLERAFQRRLDGAALAGRPPLRLEGRMVWGSPRHMSGTGAFQVALIDDATGELLAAMERSTLINPFASAGAGHRFSQEVADLLAGSLPRPNLILTEWPPAPDLAPASLAGIDHFAMAPGLDLRGHRIWIQPWREVALRKARRDAGDRAMSDDISLEAPLGLLGALAGPLSPATQVSLDNGDLLLQGRVVDVSVAAGMRSATLLMFGGGASYLNLEMRLVDAKSGKVWMQLRHRLVKMTPVEPTQGYAPGFGAFRFKFAKFTGALAEALAPFAQARP